MASHPRRAQLCYSSPSWAGGVERSDLRFRSDLGRLSRFEMEEAAVEREVM